MLGERRITDARRRSGRSRSWPSAAIPTGPATPIWPGPGSPGGAGCWPPPGSAAARQDHRGHVSPAPPIRRRPICWPAWLALQLKVPGQADQVAGEVRARPAFGGAVPAGRRHQPGPAADHHRRTEGRQPAGTARGAPPPRPAGLPVRGTAPPGRRRRLRRGADQGHGAGRQSGRRGCRRRRRPRRRQRQPRQPRLRQPTATAVKAPSSASGTGRQGAAAKATRRQTPSNRRPGGRRRSPPLRPGVDDPAVITDDESPTGVPPETDPAASNGEAPRQHHEPGSRAEAPPQPRPAKPAESS